MLRRLCVLAAITLLAAPAAPETARPAAGVLSAIDDLLGDAYPMKLPGAAAIVAVDGKAVFKRAYGLADAEFGILLEPDMVFRIGSVTKAFTAALVLKLVEQGDLSLTEPVTTYLPDSPPGWRAITLEHTLAHTSGLPNYTARPEYRARMAEALTVEELLARFAGLPLEFTPGTRWSYSNSGYAVAGAVVEQVTGRPFAEVLRDRLLAPVGLHRTMYDDPRQVVPRRARGYVVAGEEVLHAPYLHMSQPYAAGALASTLDDLAAWDTALTNGRALGGTSLDRMFTPVRLADGSLAEYGLGWMLTEYGGTRIAEHGGGIDGFRCHVVRVPDRRIFVAVLSNRGGDGRPTPLARRITALMLGAPPGSFEATDPPPATLEAYIGRYRLPGGKAVTVARRQDGLLMQFEDGGDVLLVPTAADRFVEQYGARTLIFQRDSQGRVTGYEETGWGKARSAIRE